MFHLTLLYSIQLISALYKILPAHPLAIIRQQTTCPDALRESVLKKYAPRL
jgi:hypothetical protein